MDCGEGRALGGRLVDKGDESSEGERELRKNEKAKEKGEDRTRLERIAIEHEVYSSLSVWEEAVRWAAQSEITVIH